MSCADLFSEIRDSLPDGHEFGERELALLALGGDASTEPIASPWPV
jgi:hypothetical protein